MSGGNEIGKVRVKFKVRLGKASDKSTKRTPAATEAGPSRSALQLALAHHIERSVERGVFKDYAEVARVLCVTRSRISQVLALLNLSPDLQEAILVGGLTTSERKLRSLLRHPEWETQG